MEREKKGRVTSYMIQKMESEREGEAHEQEMEMRMLSFALDNCKWKLVGMK